MQYPVCRHLQEDGTYCGSPALTGRAYCYYHLSFRGRRLRRAQARRRGLPCRLHLPALDNLRALQVAVNEVLDALAEGQIDPKTAGSMFYGIQQATTLVRSIQEIEHWVEDDDDDEDNRVQEFPQFEQKFGVPSGIDLESDPDLALQQAEENPDAPAAAPLAPPPAPPRERPVAHKPAAGEKHELSFRDLQRHLEVVEEAARRHAADKRVPASAAPPASEVADTA